MPEELRNFFGENSWLLLMIGAMLVMMSMFMGMRKRRRRSRNEPSAIEQIERDRQMRGTRGQLEDLMVEIEQMARRVGSQLDAKTMHLEKLLEEADEKIRMLKAVQSNTRVSDALESQPKSSTPVDSASLHHDVAEANKADAVSSDDPVARRVYELADGGMDAVAIARQLNEHVGKIELMLALRQ